MSERVKKYRQNLADQGKKVVEIPLPKEIVEYFQILADHYGLHRTTYISNFITNICSTDDFRSYVMQRVKTENILLDAMRNKHKAEFRDYELS